MTEISKKIINILFISGEEIDIKSIASILETDIEIIKKELQDIKPKLKDIGLDMMLHNENVSIITDSKYASLLKDFTKYEASNDLTPASLQALTVVAYLGGATSAEVSFIRGVQSTQTLRSLSTRGLVKLNLIERNGLYSLTTEAYTHLGIQNDKDLIDYEKINNSMREKLKDALNG